MKITSNVFVKWLTKEHPTGRFPMCDFERIRYEVRPSDVLLVEGRSKVSDVIRQITQSAWSHSALYIGRLHDIEDPNIRCKAKEFLEDHSPDTQWVIEGVLGKGTILTPLNDYKDDHIRICRPRGLSPNDAQQVISFAVSQLGKDYDVRQIFDLYRLLLPWSILPRRFRSKIFNQAPGQNTKTVCSTMIAEAFMSVDFPILPLVKHDAEKGIELIQRNPRLFTPRDFDYSPYFEIIKYPFIEFDNHALYRKLPWNREGLMSNDENEITKKATTTDEKEPPYDPKEFTD